MASVVPCLYIVCLHLLLSLQRVDSRILPNSHGALGLLALPISALREQEAERVSGSHHQTGHEQAHKFHKQEGNLMHVYMGIQSLKDSTALVNIIKIQIRWSSLILINVFYMNHFYLG